MTSVKQQQFSNTKFHPLTYVLKYDPPMIGMIYKLHENDSKKRLYKIYLHALIYKNDAEAITRQLFREHALHINETNVSHEQVKNLVTKLLQAKGKKPETSSGQKSQYSPDTVDLLGLEEPKGNTGIKVQDFGVPKNTQKAGGYQFRGAHNTQGDDLLELEDELQDLENEEVFHYTKPATTKVPEKKQETNTGIDFLNQLGGQKGQEEDEMDFILDDPDNLENLSDY